MLVSVTIQSNSICTPHTALWARRDRWVQVRIKKPKTICFDKNDEKKKLFMILESRLVRRTPHEHTHTHKMIFLFLAYLLFFSTQTFLSFTLFLFVLLLFIVLIPKTARARRHYIKSCRSMWVIAEMRQWPICYDYIIRQTYSITLCAWHTVYVYICHSKMDNKNVSKRKKKAKMAAFFCLFRVVGMMVLIFIDDRYWCYGDSFVAMNKMYWVCVWTLYSGARDFYSLSVRAIYVTHTRISMSIHIQFNATGCLLRWFCCIEYMQYLISNTQH